MKKIIKLIIFVAVLLPIILVVFAILRPKNDESLIIAEDFYKQQNNSIDVLFLGSSRTVMNINPYEIWDQAAIRSYAYGAMGQPLWSSYHYLVEALKYQSPSVVVLEVGMLSFKEEYADYNFIVKNTIGLKLSQNRLDNIQVSAPQDMHLDLMLGFPVYHNRYDELTTVDWTLGLVGKDSTYKGFTPSNNVVVFDVPHDESDDVVFEPSDKSLSYLNKILDLCEQEGIEVLLLATPDIITEESGWSEVNDSIAAYVTQIAEQRGLDFIYSDEIAGEIGIDYSIDFRDERHLNILGAKKFSRFIADYLSDNYNIISNPTDSEQWDEGYSAFINNTAPK